VHEADIKHVRMKRQACRQVPAIQASRQAQQGTNAAPPHCLSPSLHPHTPPPTPPPSYQSNTVITGKSAQSQHAVWVGRVDAGDRPATTIWRSRGQSQLSTCLYEWTLSTLFRTSETSRDYLGIFRTPNKVTCIHDQDKTVLHATSSLLSLARPDGASSRDELISRFAGAQTRTALRGDRSSMQLCI
jgi:hypothetical protein